VRHEQTRIAKRCLNCGDPIHIHVLKGAGWCCDCCRKALKVKEAEFPLAA